MHYTDNSRYFSGWHNFLTLDFEEHIPFVFGPPNPFTKDPIPGNVRRNTLHLCEHRCGVICVAKRNIWVISQQLLVWCIMTLSFVN